MIKLLQNNRELTALLAILALFALLGGINRNDIDIQTPLLIFGSAQTLSLLALGATLVMLTRNIDVSVGSITGLCAVALGLMLEHGWGLAPSLLITLFIGMGAGMVNGVLVTVCRIPSIVATLGTLGLYRGLMLLVTGGRWIENLPASLKSLANPLWLGVSPFGWLIVLLAAGLFWFCRRTAFGRGFYAAGDNLAGARQLGVPVDFVRITAFTFNGLMAALAGMVFAAQIGFVPNQTGSGLEMKAIAACVLGGVSLLGGTGTVAGAVLGAYFLTQIDSVLVLLRLPAWWNDFIAGLVLLGVLIFDGRLRRALEMTRRRQKYARFMPTPSRPVPAKKGQRRGPGEARRIPFAAGGKSGAAR
ncbi:autoinducer 2 ABC transporter permease LsrC [Martelella alba]|uniref:Autoinducer 2 import system permease protein LsrC n=1 Tax=Martelella alba TaxID=2590451 RepID=A0ABY2SLS5_9HYPH|nr:autoinducer 2 ABC transporter permease LsrC [Martelella alba]TKI06154.1 autoinducer 2 ABC transporter permease LsrC [Martelella alba]